MVGPECNWTKHYSVLIVLLFTVNTVSNSFPPLLSHHINLPPIFQSTSSLGIPMLALIHLHLAVMPLVVVSLPTEPTLLPTLKAVSFQKALLTAQKGRQSSNIMISSGQPSASVSQQYNSTQQRNRKINQSEKTIPLLDDHPLSPPLSVVHKNSLKLFISHFDTPFKLEAVPHTEEWSPTTEELKHNINGIYCTSTFGHIIKQTGLWDTLTTMKPNCMFNDFPVRIADAKHMKSYGTLLSLQ